ncbi:MAG: GNAT family N-acetyltransferase [Hyphomonadaceae bacterium]|nr:GNAT family N-acetyltransferase [Hyphomonadaceae bacterium]
MGVTIRDAAEADEAFILALNAASTPAVGEMDAKDYRDIAAQAYRILIAEAGGEPAGFLILIRPGSAYPSDNYGWFEEQFDRHLYIDRIAISASAKGQGVGRALYDAALADAARLGELRLTAEVNEQPPNPESMAFHEKLGFRHLLSRTSPRLGKVVAMLERPL